MPDAAVLAAITDEMLLDFGVHDPAGLRVEVEALPAPDLPRPQVGPAPAATLEKGEAVLATWRQLIDDGSMQSGEPYMAATARPAVIRLSAANAANLGIADGEPVTISTQSGALTLPALVTDMPSGIVWAPANSAVNLLAELGVTAGDTVRVSVGRAS